MTWLDGRGNQAVSVAFFVLAIVWFVTGRSGLGAAFVAIGAVFIALDQQKRGPKE